MADGDRSLEREIETLHDELATMHHYKLLRIPRSSGQPEIKRAYRRMAQHFHPDKHRTSLSPELLAKLGDVFNQVTTAYNTLGNREHRAEYDEELQLVEESGHHGLSGKELREVEALYQAGKEAYSKKDVLRSISIFEQLTAMSPRHPEFHAKLALARMAIPKLRKEALSSVEQAIMLNRENAHYHALQGRILLKLKEVDEAEVCFRRALSWSPNSRPARQGLQKVAEIREANREDLGARLKRRWKSMTTSQKKKAPERPKELKSRLAGQPRKSESSKE